MDTFDYSSHLLYRLALAHEPASPLQIEFHPGVHCDLYQCPHCYGHGQFPVKGGALTAEEIDQALASIERAKPTVIVSGITTEPLTHPNAAGIIRAVRKRGLTLGVYTKGYRLNDETCEALVEPGGFTFVTVSLDSVTKEDYMAKHGLTSSNKGAARGSSGATYFDSVCEGLERLRSARDAAGSNTQIRGSFLLFDDTAHQDTIAAAVELFGSDADLLRFSLPQNRNDGCSPGEMSTNPGETLTRLQDKFRDNNKVRILTETSARARTPCFSRCWAQHFQVTIDKSGNVFPCPQVAVSNYRSLVIGNIRDQSLKDILEGEARAKMFEKDVDSEMGCRICDRKDEALNVTLSRLNNAYADFT